MAATPYPSKPDFVDLHMAYRAVRDDKGFRALIGPVLRTRLFGTSVLKFVNIRHIL